MTKEQLEAENERLGAEVAALRELLTVIAGGNPPMYAVPGNHRDGWLQTGHDRLVAATGAAGHAMRYAGTDGFTMALRAMSGYLRHEFDRPLGYEPKAAEPAPADDAWRLTPKGIEAAEAANPPHHYVPVAESGCDARDSGYTCNAQAGHDAPDHVAYGSDDQECHRWPTASPELEDRCPDHDGPIGSSRCIRAAGHDAAHFNADGNQWGTTAELKAMREQPYPVITDSERDCGERNLDGSGEPCHRDGDHGVHRDSNGDEWRTDGPGGVEFGPFYDEQTAATA